MVIDKNTNRLGRNNFYVMFFFALYTFKLKKKISFCQLHSLYFALLTQFFGNKLDWNGMASEQSSVPSLPFLPCVLLCLVWHTSGKKLEHVMLNKRFGVS